MSKVIANRSDLVAVADAIRSKTGETDGLTLAQMPNAVAGITGGAETGTVKLINTSGREIQIHYMRPEGTTGAVRLATNSSVTIYCAVPSHIVTNITLVKYSGTGGVLASAFGVGGGMGHVVAGDGTLSISPSDNGSGD